MEPSDHLSNTRSINKKKQIILLTLWSVFSCTLFGYKHYSIDSWFFSFLNWNLFLAFVPWAISSMLVIFPRLRDYKLLIFLMFVLWVLFFPNSPYILTDLFHLKSRKMIRIWLDMIMIFSFAWTGLLFGYYSLRDMVLLCEGKINRKLLTVLVILFNYLISFGVFAGRYLRWNSWDIVDNPNIIWNDLTDLFLHPVPKYPALGITLALGTLLNLMYWGVLLMQNNKKTW